MDGQLWVIVYSKFSQNCTNLFNFIQSSNIEIDFKAVCIDDKKTRKRILKDEKFTFKTVPTILGVNLNNGIVSQYEGEKAFKLVDSMIPKPPPPNPKQPPKVTMLAETITQQPDKKDSYAPQSMSNQPQTLGIGEPGHTSVDDLFGDGGGVQTVLPITSPPQENKPPGDTKKISVAEVMKQMKLEKEQHDSQFKSGNKVVY